MSTQKVNELSVAQTNVNNLQYTFADLLAKESWVINGKNVSVDIHSRTTKDPVIGGGKTTYTVYVDGVQYEHTDIETLKKKYLDTHVKGRPHANGRRENKIKLAEVYINFALKHPDKAKRTLSIIRSVRINAELEKAKETQISKLMKLGYSRETAVAMFAVSEIK